MRRRRVSPFRVAFLIVLAGSILFFVLMLVQPVSSAAVITIIALWLFLLAAVAIAMGVQGTKGLLALSRQARLAWRTRVWIDRKRKNLCLHCGYDLTGNLSGVCSECGNAFRRYSA